MTLRPPQKYSQNCSLTLIVVNTNYLFMRFMFLITVLALLPVTALAEKVTILPVSYQIAKTDIRSADAAPLSENEDTVGFKTDTEEQEPKRNRLSPEAFWATFGVTGALLAGWAITESIVFNRHNTLEAGDRDRAYWDTTQNLQKVEWALFSAAGAGVAATIVLLFFTNFDEENDKMKGESQAFSVAPAALENGGMMMFHKKF